MLRHLRPAALIATAALAAGCGSSTTSDPSAPDAQRGAENAPASQLRVGAMGSGIGQAATGAPGGVKLLPDTRVPGTPNTEQGIGAGANCDNANLMPEGDNLGAIEAATLCLINGERDDAGMRALRTDAKLEKAAKRHSRAMVDRGFFDHVGLNGSDPVDRIRAAGYIPDSGSWTIGENLAWGTGSLATPKGIVAAWMRSQGHRENILRRSYKEIGFGIVLGNPRSNSGSGATYTTTFGAVSRPARRARRAQTSRKNRPRVRMMARISVPRGG